MMRATATSALILGALVSAACGGSGAPASNAAWFTEEAADRGLDFRHDNGHDDTTFYMAEIVSGGAALFDMDDDGDLDAYTVQSGYILDDPAARPENRLYENVGDGRFRDVTEASGTGDRGWGLGVACGDVDEDGDIDLYVTNHGANKLYRNDGGGRFSDITDSAGVGDASFGASAGFFDYDRDGDLDLYVTNYLNWEPAREIECYNRMGGVDYCGPNNYDAAAQDVLYRNDGNGTFTDVTEEMGLTAGFGNGLGVVFADFDDDGWLDVFVANDGREDQLWANRAGTGFENVALERGCAVDWEAATPKAGMGVTAADIDGDDDLDLMVCNLVEESDSVFINEGTKFDDGTARVGLGAISRAFTRFGLGWVDFDNDGHFDLYEANGRVMKKRPNFSDDWYAEPNLVFRGDGQRFVEVEPRGGTAEPVLGSSRAAAFGDVDGDGGVDVLVVNNGGPTHLLMNGVPGRGPSVQLDVRERSGRPALGAVVRITVGERVLRRDVRSDSSYLACIDPRIVVGLGEATAIDAVEVTWVDGVVERFPGAEAGAQLRLNRGQGG